LTDAEHGAAAGRGAAVAFGAVAGPAGAWLALLAPWIAPKDPLAQDLFLGRLPPFWMRGRRARLLAWHRPSGRDVLSRILHGARLALTVALVAGTLTCLVGATLGLMAGFLRGWVDLVISRLVDIWMAFPPVLFSILLIAVLGPGLFSIIIAIVVIDWTRFARVVRAEAMTQGAMDYVASARSRGAGASAPWPCGKSCRMCCPPSSCC
jgi:dipeptide transport system permease protein